MKEAFIQAAILLLEAYNRESKEEQKVEKESHQRKEKNSHASD